MTELHVRDWSRMDQVLISRLEFPFLIPRRRSESGTVEIVGIGFRCGSDAYSVSCRREQFYFRINDLEWRIENRGISSSYRRAALVEYFSITCRSRSTVRKLYFRSDALRRLVEDPALDGLDHLEIYPLEWCHRVIQSPEKRDHLLNQWSKRSFRFLPLSG